MAASPSHPTASPDNAQRAERRTAWSLGLVSLLIQVPFLLRGLSLHDEGNTFAIADALHGGDVLYRDLVTSIGPLTYELLAQVFRWFGPSFLAGRILQLLVFSGCVIMGYAILCRVVSQRAALLGALSLLVLKPVAFRTWTMLNYSQVAMLLALAALLLGLRFLERRRLVWLVASGAAAGLCLLAKLNYGGVIGLALGMGIALDWLGDPKRSPGALFGRGLALLVGAVLPLAIALAAYASQGAAGAFLDQSVVLVALQRADFWVPLPGLGLWASPDGPGMNAFTYFPGPLFNLGWEGALTFSSVPLVLLIEVFVKLAYYVPVLLLVGGTVQLVKTRGSRLESVGWNSRLLVLAFGGGIYASMLHRADWSHLMSIYPASILLGTTVLAHPVHPSRRLKTIGVFLCVAWILAGLAMTAAVLRAYATPIETAYGRILTTRSRAAEVKPVLAHLEAQPRRAKILVLRGEPMYYFLSRRRIPGVHDVLLPGLVPPQADARLAALVPDLDQILYNPNETPLIPLPLGRYAPLTSAAVARSFRIEEQLTRSALVLNPRTDVRQETVLDVWDQTTQPDATRREHWIVYRVLIPERPQDLGGCFSVPHLAAAGQSISTLPIFHPNSWLGTSGESATFEVVIREGSSERSLRNETYEPGIPPEPFRLPLDEFAGRRIEIRFCIRDAAPETRAGWAEPRVVRPGKGFPVTGRILQGGT